MEAVIENEETGVDGEDDFYSPSSLSSSPPKDFDINLESQYIPIFDEDNSPEGPHSLASSLSIESHHDYTTSPVILTSNCRIIRCPVCEKPMRTFYCAKCIQKGQFVTIAEPKIDEFTATVASKLRLPPLYEIPTVGENSDCMKDEQKVLEEALQTKLSILGKKTEALRNLLKDQQIKLGQTQGLVFDTRAKLENDKKSHKSMESKIELIKRYIASRKASVEKRRNYETNLIDELKQHASRKVFQLTNDVFPIEEINLLDQNTSFVNMETSPLLTFSDGSHHQIEQQTAFSIVEPWLPSNGDYSVDSFWLNDNEDHIAASMSDLSERNPAFRIGAGLTYTAQLVINLASYLNVILPAIIDLNTFNRQPLNDVQFSYNVAKLNANVIYLCISQGIDVSLLHPHRTLKNLILLLNPNVCDLGRKPIVEVDNEEAAKKIEDQFGSDLSLIQDDFYDFGRFEDTDDISDSEWEISDSSVAHMEVLPSGIEQSMQQNSYIARLPLRLLASFWTTGS